jgi:hypothetical protein
MKLSHVGAALLMAISLTRTVHAGASLMNGGFEDFVNSSEPVDWNRLGSMTSTAFTIFELSPLEGNRIGMAETAFTPAADPSSVEMALSLPAGTFNSASATGASGVAIGWQDVSVNAGDVLEFHWGFVTTNNAIPSNDLGFVLIDDTLSVVSTQAGVTTLVPHSSYAKTEWMFSQYPITSTGFIHVGFGVINGTGGANGSALVLDDVRIIPEPASALTLILLGGLATARLGRRRCTGNTAR